MTTENKDLALFSRDNNTMPAFVLGDGALGNENVKTEDQALPQLKIMQPLSPEAENIPGAKNGALFNSVTNELFDKIYAINLNFTKQFSVFKQRAKGGGFFGKFDTEEAALEHIKTLEGNAADYQAIETGVHYLLLLDAQGQPTTPAIMYMKGTALNASRNWNSKISIENKGGPRFCTVWELGTEKQSNSKGSWWTPVATFAGFVNEDLYETAKLNYENLKTV